MALVELMGRPRQETGKGAAHVLRAAGFLPGVVYGPGGENILISVEKHSFEHLLRRAAEGAVIVDLRLQGETNAGLQVLVKEVQRDPATAQPLHVDFVHIAMDRPVKVSVPVRLQGTAEGVKTEGGFLDHVLRDIEVECLPSLIPNYIVLDVSELKIGNSLHASDVQVPDCRVVTPGDRVIVAVHGKHAGAEEEELAEAPKPEEAEGAEGKAGAETGESGGASGPARS